MIQNLRWVSSNSRAKPLLISPLQRPSASRRWCFTLNNPGETDADHLRALFPERLSFLVFGREHAPGTGTVHLQGYLELSRAARLSALKKILGLPAIHLEPAKGNAQQNIDYCRKEDPEATQLGEPALPTGHAGGQANKRRYQDAIDLAKSDKLDDIDADILLRSFGTLRTMREEALWERSRARVHQPDLVLRGWQSDLLHRLELPPDDREIIFVYDPTGNSGKTTFCRWLSSHPDWQSKCQVLHPSRGVDMAYLIQPKDIYLLDCPRASGDHIPWATVEALKNGHVVSTKYMPLEKVFPTPHVVLFVNSMPEEGILSADRIFQLTTW